MCKGSTGLTTADLDNVLPAEAHYLAEALALRLDVRRAVCLMATLQERWQPGREWAEIIRQLWVWLG